MRRVLLDSSQDKCGPTQNIQAIEHGSGLLSKKLGKLQREWGVRKMQALPLLIDGAELSNSNPLHLYRGADGCVTCRPLIWGGQAKTAGNRQFTCVYDAGFGHHLVTRQEESQPAQFLVLPGESQANFIGVYGPFTG